MYTTGHFCFTHRPISFLKPYRSRFGRMSSSKLIMLSCLFILPHFLAGQTVAVPEASVADFKVFLEGDAVTFTPVLPPLSQVAGAPKAYWTYLWEFGDGDKSTQEAPRHVYSGAGEYSATLDVIAHYDDGKKPTRKKSKVVAPNRESLTSAPMEDVFDAKSRQAIALASAANPRAGEELSFVLSYRNKGSLPINGSLHLFFNEKKFPSPHFKFLESRPCFGEIEAPLYSDETPDGPGLPYSNWSNIGLLAPSQLQIATRPANSPTPSILLDARGKYREERAWKFENLDADARRNFFFSLEGASTLIKDVNTLIHLEAIIVPDDPSLPAEPCILELEIVASHDPNVIAVSDNRINYRIIDNKALDYKIRFQNNGEGPAGTVNVAIEIPKGLNIQKLEPLDWQPKCPICPKTPTKNSCLDTVFTENGLIFIFRNIYLPGSNQAGVNNLDSTKGFVKYRIAADHQMPKYPFSSRARIVFDRHAPIFTNYTHTRFKVGISPGIKVGWNVLPDSLKGGYYFIGATLSPFKSWRMYPQMEFLTGLKGRQNLPEKQMQGLIITGINGAAFKDTTYLDTIIQTQRGFVSFEIPLLLRKNFNKHLGLGLGLSTRLSIENGETSTKTQQTSIHWTDSSVGFVQEIKQGESKKVVASYSSTHYHYLAFGDLSLGSVRAGPNLGIRAGALFGKGQTVRPFIQVSVEVKL